MLGSAVGTAVYQPEFSNLPPSSADLLGTLARSSFPTEPSFLPPFKPIGFTDAACFSIGRAAAAEVVQIGPITGSAVPQLNDRVRKRGKTTLLTHGVITAIGAYENRGSILSNQFEVTVDSNLSTEWSNSGDSGSLVVRKLSGEVVGLHCGGTGGTYGYASDIETTAAELGISLFWPIPQVSSISPFQCNSQGGDQVDIDGIGFQLASAVSFGGVAALSFEVQSDQRIVAIVPPGNGVATAIVNAPGGSSDPLISASIAYF
ncbi:IPT/TIG domain-containing protein [Mesorhizobium sp. M0954]|uniref:IPT/TIG domain-containing protein n=1 Tax=Mesorhizobium sp. M0954 TaxID=2957032 RepID=UPI003335E6A1